MRSTLVVGSGERVVGSALPAFLSAAEHFRIDGVYSRRAKRIAAADCGPGADRTFEVEPLEALERRGFEDGELVYMVVAKDAVPSVLKRLVALDPSGIDLLIETPVLRFKLLGHLGLLERFRSVWVSEDTARLPAFETVEAFRRERGLGPVRRATLERSAWAYHGVAMGRALLGGGRVLSGRRARGGGGAVRTIRYEGGGELAAIEPRDYAAGRVHLELDGATISDAPNRAPHRLAALVEAGRCTGFRVDDFALELDPTERGLMGSPLADRLDEDGGVTVWMEGMKRVGFRRLLLELARGEGGYPLELALEDTVVDYHLDRFGRYRRSLLTSPDRAPARALLRALTAIAG